MKAFMPDRTCHGHMCSLAVIPMQAMNVLISSSSHRAASTVLASDLRSPISQIQIRQITLKVIHMHCVYTI
jgi:hypothetical protein